MIVIAVFAVGKRHTEGYQGQVDMPARIVVSSSSVDLVEEVHELLKIYFVVWFRTRYLNHSCSFAPIRNQYVRQILQKDHRGLVWPVTALHATTYSGFLRQRLSLRAMKRRTWGLDYLCILSYRCGNKGKGISKHKKLGIVVVSQSKKKLIAISLIMRKLLHWALVTYFSRSNMEKAKTR